MNLGFDTFATIATLVFAAIAAAGTLWLAWLAHVAARRQPPSLVATFKPLQGHPGWIKVSANTLGAPERPFIITGVRVLRPRGARGLPVSATRGQPASANHQTPFIAPRLEDATAGTLPFERKMYILGYEKYFRHEALFFHKSFARQPPEFIEIRIAWSWRDQRRRKYKMPVTASVSMLPD
ncbi:MAG: hypothetical protein ABGW90_09640 [Martelella sp.]